jgi:glucose/arabinose dehydrogenase
MPRVPILKHLPLALIACLGAALIGCEDDEPAGPVDLSLALQVVATNLDHPVFLTSPPNDHDRLFVLEKKGTIRIIKNGQLLDTSFLDISGGVATGNEQGLLGMAFSPGYASDGRFYVSYIDLSGDSRIARYMASVDDPDVADPMPDILLTVVQPDDYNNGGMIAFGPDGYLYVGLGDGNGAGGGDTGGYGQSLDDLLGAVLRIDVSGDGPYSVPADNPFVDDPEARSEVWDYGLRNPWRFSFDSETGNLYIGDVGRDDFEEVNVESTVTGIGGVNFGWDIMEGRSCHNPPSDCDRTGLTEPALEYAHTADPDCSGSVVGGYVYHGSAVPEARGLYFYSDYCAGWVKSFRHSNGGAIDQQDWPTLQLSDNVTSFGEDANGELYILTAGGRVYRIVKT